MSLLPYPDRAAKPIGDYRLVVYDTLGQSVRNTFTRDSPGINGEIVALVSPLYGCKNMTLTARPDKLGVDGGEIAQLFLKDRSGVYTAISYGRFKNLRGSERSKALHKYVISADEILSGSTVDGKIYRNLDAASIAFDYALRCRHPATKAPRLADFPPTGVILPVFSSAGDPLDEAFNKLAKEAAVSGAIIGHGLDANGYLFFKPNTKRITLPYREETYTDLETDAEDLATAIHFVILGEPTIVPWAGAYSPKTLEYITVPNPQLHARYGSRRPGTTPEGVFIPFAGATVSAVNFTNPNNATAADYPATPAARSGSALSTYAILNDDPNVYGVLLSYQTSDTTPQVKLRVSTQHTSGAGATYEAELPGSEGEYKEEPYYFPPAEDRSTGAFEYFSRIEIRIPAGGTFLLRRAHLMRLDVDRLDALGAQLQKIPARLPSQFVPQKEAEDGRIYDYLEEIGSSLLVPATPWGDQVSDISEYRFAFDPGRGCYTVIDAGQPARDSEASLERKIKLGLARDLDLQRLQAARTRARR